MTKVHSPTKSKVTVKSRVASTKQRAKTIKRPAKRLSKRPSFSARSGSQPESAKWLLAELRKLSDPQRALVSGKFFKTGKGQYGEGDEFLGVPMSEVRKLAQLGVGLSPSDVSALLKARYHEERMLGVQILVASYRQADAESEALRWVMLYRRSISRLNNWDFVDVSAYNVLGDFTFRHGDFSELVALAKSPGHWHRRVAMVGTWGWTRHGVLDPVYQVADLVIGNSEDLMRKACGWMLREAGKKDLPRLRRFLAKNFRRMSRTTLRYAIERMSSTERKAWLNK